MKPCFGFFGKLFGHKFRWINVTHGNDPRITRTTACKRCGLFQWQAVDNG